MTRTDSWFTVDKDGLREQLAGQAKGRPLWELWQNAVDENVTTVTIELTPTVVRGVARLVVTDDSPEGFADLTDAWTFYKPSKKAGDAEKRGRFNTGEKTVLALCKSATIASTKGRVSFDEDGTRTFSARTKRAAGSEFDGLIRYTRPDIDEALADMRRVLVPDTGIKVTVNGEPLEPRSPVRSFTATLETRIDFRPTRRQTTVEVYEVGADETPTIYELGIPVVEHDGRWHINVLQKVPLNADRDNVTPGYLRALRTAVLNEMAAELTVDDAHSTWVTDALPHAEDDAFRTALKKRVGKAVVYDPSDPEANKRAIDKGYGLVTGRSLPKAVFARNRELGVIRPAGKVLPSGVPTSPDGKPPIPRDDWTEAMENVARYTVEVGEHLLGPEAQVRVAFQQINNGHLAWWGDYEVTFNLGRLGPYWPREVTTEQLDELLIHEFAHNAASDHLSSAFYTECCRLGAKLRNCKAELR